MQRLLLARKTEKRKRAGLVQLQHAGGELRATVGVLSTINGMKWTAHDGVLALVGVSRAFQGCGVGRACGRVGWTRKLAYVLYPRASKLE